MTVQHLLGRWPYRQNRRALLADTVLFLVSPLLALGLRLDGALQLHIYYPQILWFTLLGRKDSGGYAAKGVSSSAEG